MVPRAKLYLILLCIRRRVDEKRELFLTLRLSDTELSAPSLPSFSSWGKTGTTIRLHSDVISARLVSQDPDTGTYLWLALQES